jgi:hypothetical protein
MMPCWLVSAGRFLNDGSPAITAIATGIIAWFTATLWTNAKNELRHNREVERAYVAGGGIRQLATVLYAGQPTPAQIPLNGQSFQQQDGRFVVVAPNGQFEVHINNHGKTTARTHHFQWGFCDASSRPPLPIQYGPLLPLRDDIGPATQSRVVTTVPIQPQPSGRTAVFGRFHWDDIWGNHWSSGFTYEIPSGPVTSNGSISIEAPSEYWADVDESKTLYP